MLTALEFKPSAPSVKNAKRGRITKTICTSAASLLLIGLMSIIPSKSANPFYSKITSSFLWNILRWEVRSLSSSSSNNHQPTLRQSMCHQLAHTSISTRCRCGGTGCCHSVDGSSLSCAVGKICFHQSGDSVWPLWNLHQCTQSVAFSLRLADHWLRLDLWCQEPRSIFR